MLNHLNSVNTFMAYMLQEASYPLSCATYTYPYKVIPSFRLCSHIFYSVLIQHAHYMSHSSYSL